MDFKNGILAINGEIFSPGYTFDDFKKSSFFDNQDGVRIIRLKNQYIVDGHTYIVNLFFRDFLLYMITLVCTDKDISFENEMERYELHKSILYEYGLFDVNYFEWGSIKAKYDPRSNLSSINIMYK